MFRNCSTFARFMPLRSCLTESLRQRQRARLLQTSRLFSDVRTPTQSVAPRSVVIDTDPGVDDALALLLAFGSPEAIKVEGLTIVCGNGCDIETLGANARLISRLAGCEGVSVSLGKAKRLEGGGGARVHGEDGLGNVASRYDRRDSDFDAFDVRPAHDFIYEACAAAPGEVSIVCIGPLTNLAASLHAHPDLPKLAREVVIMGGAVGAMRGNMTPAAEANFANDPAAAQAVMTAGFRRVVLAGLDVTHQTDVGVLREACGHLGSPAGRFVWDICQFYMDVYRGFGQTTAPAHDAVPIFYLLRPDLFTSQSARVEVETKGALTTGMSIADWHGQWQRPANCEVLLSVDADAFASAFVGAVAELPRSHS